MVTSVIDDKIFIEYKDEALKEFFESDSNKEDYDSFVDETMDVANEYPSGKVSIYLTYDESVEEWYVDHYSEKN